MNKYISICVNEPTNISSTQMNGHTKYYLPKAIPTRSADFYTLNDVHLNKTNTLELIFSQNKVPLLKRNVKFFFGIFYSSIILSLLMINTKGWGIFLLHSTMGYHFSSIFLFSLSMGYLRAIFAMVYLNLFTKYTRTKESIFFAFGID